MFYYGADMDEEKEQEKQEEAVKEEAVKEEQTPQVEQTPRTFTDYQPKSRQPKGKPTKIAVTVGILLLVVLLGWSFLQRLRGGPAPEPEQATQGAVVETLTPAPTPSIEKAELELEVLNGTGISGEAGFLQGELGELGYTTVEIGNASRSDYEETQVFFSSDFPQGLRTELLSALEDIYTRVEASSGDTGGFDVRIITGLRKGVTPRPSPTPTPTPTPTLSPSPTATASPTLSP